ncbi:hypothetical protein NC652_010228 [Populus alba x Populus x berolinensis]|nr:hypothetical protein NC652_010228 [Populus alba x Populus x berolinensis]
MKRRWVTDTGVEGGNMGLVGDCSSGAFARVGEGCLGFVWRQGLGVMAIVFKFVREKAGLGDELCGVSGVSMGGVAVTKKTAGVWEGGFGLEVTG